MTASPRNLAMKRKITLAVLVTSTACLIAACVALFLIQIRSFRRTFVSDLSTIGEVIATISADSVALHDNGRADEILDSLRAKPDVVSATILAKDGTPLAHFGDADDAAIQQKYPPENGFVFFQVFLQELPDSRDDIIPIRIGSLGERNEIAGDKDAFDKRKAEQLDGQGGWLGSFRIREIDALARI